MGIDEIIDRKIMDKEEVLYKDIKACENFDTGHLWENTGIVYPFTTENISGYINKFNLEDRSLLTVGSSGDQVINAILYDCKDITLYDKVLQSRYYFYLKCAGLLCLTKDEFLAFFKYREFHVIKYGDNADVFNKKTYNKIKDTLRLLDYESYIYYDELFNTFTGLTIRKTLFETDEFRTDLIIKHNPYLKSELDYSEAKEKIKKVRPKFIYDNIFNISDQNKYDNIWLSNIATWLNDEKQIIKLVDKTEKCLNENGKLMISYLYGKVKGIKYQSNWAPIYNLKRMHEILKKYNVRLEEFEGVNKRSYNKDKDNILVLKK